ncbi:MAG: cytochrome c maturation protein CcmE [Stagnimonas sp.]|nr:cytochrome c maturation protein CcmE [Stagnimonas sp.]
MTKRQSRMLAVAALVLGVGLAAAFGVTAFRKNMMYFQTPSDLVAGKSPVGAKVRLGGLVERGSVSRGEGLLVRFRLADCVKVIAVRYEGILPDLFREGQGIVATGALAADGQFVADEVLAKHDENYISPDLAASLKEQGGKHSCGEFKNTTATVTP